MKMIGDEALEDWANHFRTAEFTPAAVAELECSDEDIYDSLEVLDAERYIEISRTMGPRPGNMSRFELTRSGLDNLSVQLRRLATQ